MPRCKLCREEAELIDAHVIPVSFYGALRRSGTPKVYSTARGSHPKRRPKGIYDKRMLCGSCDGRIGVWDQHAAENLMRPLDHFGDPSEILAQEYFQIDDVDYARLKLFFISLLWRAHHSRQRFFEAVHLGPWADEARQMILDVDPGPPQKFAVALVRYEHRLATSIHGPERVRFEGVGGYRFSFPDHAAMIKVDSRELPHDLYGFLLTPDKPFHVAVFDYEESPLFQTAVRNFRKHPSRR